MLGLTKKVIAIGLRAPCFALIALYASSCAGSATGTRENTTVDALLRDGKAFNGKSIAFSGCLDAVEHGLVVLACPHGEQGIPVLYSDDMRAEHRSNLYAKALQSKIKEKHPLPVTLCGMYHQTGDGRDRWFEVVAYSLGGANFGGGPVCRTLSGP